MMKTLGILVMILLAGGCASIERNTNRDNLAKLRVGLTKEQVQGIMGEPQGTEAAGRKEIWLYPTGGRRMNRGFDKPTYTPLLFDDGILAGWGDRFVVRPQS